jgi:hypothetical protein
MRHREGKYRAASFVLVLPHGKTQFCIVQYEKSLLERRALRMAQASEVPRRVLGRRWRRCRSGVVLRYSDGAPA